MGLGVPLGIVLKHAGTGKADAIKEDGHGGRFWAMSLHIDPKGRGPPLTGTSRQEFRGQSPLGFPLYGKVLGAIANLALRAQ